MNNSQHIRHYHRHIGYSYPVSVWQRFYSLILIPTLVMLAVFVILKLVAVYNPASVETVDFTVLLSALGSTFFRLVVAYVLAVVFAIPLAILISYNALAERILLPLFDIIQSVPVLAFFPVIILFFVHYNLLNGAAVFILFVTMTWSMVFSVVGGLRIIPSDIKDAAKVFHIRGWRYFRKILLPAVVPYLVTGSLLAWAGGWNIIIVAEVLHTYIPNGSASQDLFGIGNILVSSSATGQHQLFFWAILFMIVAVGLLNFFVWQKLLRYAEKYKFE